MSELDIIIFLLLSYVVVMVTGRGRSMQAKIITAVAVWCFIADSGFVLMKLASQGMTKELFWSIPPLGFTITGLFIWVIKMDERLSSSHY